MKKNCIDEVGGYRNQISLLLKLFDHLFFKTGKSDIQIHGVLVHGRSGTGKSLLLEFARRFLEEKGINVYDLGGLIFKQFSKNEMKMKDLFTKAVESEPSCIFCDDIDICLKSRRLVRTCGSLMETFSGRRVMIIASSKSINAVDRDLRRYKRFEKEMLLPVPSENDRFDILKKLFFSFKISVDQRYIAFLSENCHGFVGSDLKNLVEKFIFKMNRNRSSRKQENEIEICRRVMKEVRPSVIKDFEVNIAKVRWVDIGGQDNLKKSLIECIEWKFQHKESFKKFKLRSPKGVLLYGPPGCSKTLAAKALATECHLNFVSVKGPELFSKWVGESEKAVHSLFQKARDASPCILFFDEIDGLAVERGSDNQSAVGDRVLSQLLNELDGIDELEDVVLVAATNRPDLIDKALLRPGRIDRMVYVKPPDYKSRIEILKIYINKMKENKISEKAILVCAKNTENFSGAELCALVRESAYLALFEKIEKDKLIRTEKNKNKKNKNHKEDEMIYVTDEHLQKASMKIKSRISVDMLRFYEEFSSKYSNY